MKKIALGCALLGLIFNVYSFKILIVTDIFPHPSRPFILNQITGLIDRGHEVVILADKAAGDVKSVASYNLARKTIYGKLPKNLDTYDIVYCQIGHLAPKFADYKIAHKARWKLVTAIRGFDATTLILKNPTVYKKLFKCGDLFLPVCEYFKECLVADGANPEKVKVHHSGIDCSEFVFSEHMPRKDGKVNLITVARLDPMKGHEYAIQAVAKLVKKNSKINYTIVGSGRGEKKLNELIQALGCQNNIKLMGGRPHNEVAALLKDAHIALLASVTTDDMTKEGIPNALMEAMACGLPVVSTYHSGIPELVLNGGSGFLVPEKDIDAMAERLEHLIKFPEYWSIFGRVGRAHVLREHDIETNNNRLEMLLSNLLKKN